MDSITTIDGKEIRMQDIGYLAFQGPMINEDGDTVFIGKGYIEHNFETFEIYLGNDDISSLKLVYILNDRIDLEKGKEVKSKDLNNFKSKLVESVVKARVKSPFRASIAFGITFSEAKELLRVVYLNGLMDDYIE